MKRTDEDELIRWAAESREKGRIKKGKHKDRCREIDLEMATDVTRWRAVTKRTDPFLLHRGDPRDEEGDEGDDDEMKMKVWVRDG